MKFQPETVEGVNILTRVDAAGIWLGPVRQGHSVLVPWLGPLVDWPVAAFEELAVQHFEQVAALRPEVVVFGSGARLRFAHPALLRPLIERGIGVETMDTAAACRTFNVLAGERRSVVGAFLLAPLE